MKKIKKRLIKDYPYSTNEWYSIVNDIIPYKVKLKQLNIIQDALCVECNNEDTIQHYATKCAKFNSIIMYIESKINVIVCQISSEYLFMKLMTRPSYKFYHRTKNKIIAWFILI